MNDTGSNSTQESERSDAVEYRLIPENHAYRGKILAKTFGVSQGTIDMIVTWKTWFDLDLDLDVAMKG